MFAQYLFICDINPYLHPYFPVVSGDYRHCRHFNKPNELEWIHRICQHCIATTREKTTRIHHCQKTDSLPSLTAHYCIYISHLKGNWSYSVVQSDPTWRHLRRVCLCRCVCMHSNYVTSMNPKPPNGWVYVYTQTHVPWIHKKVYLRYVYQ